MLGSMQVKLDFAILPIGDNFTMGVDDAVLAARALSLPLREVLALAEQAARLLN
mgnify:CR=1 FL=1